LYREIFFIAFFNYDIVQMSDFSPGSKEKRIVIVGGGISGLVTASLLAGSGVPVTLIEKKEYPLNRVCGEYVSNEAAPFLKAAGLYPEQFTPAIIRRLQLTSVSGDSAYLNLDLGGFGISRFSFDSFLATKANEAGAKIIQGCEVSKVSFDSSVFKLETSHGAIESDVVIGAFGKRSKLDSFLQREFIRKKSPYLGVKYHIRIEHPRDLIALHNFQGGYCGISNVEDDKTNLCYLTHRANLNPHENLESMQKRVLFKNPHLKRIFSEAEFVFKRPEVINEVSFETKRPVENHILMTGDAAGMITPLCGNGMAIAIQSAKFLSELCLRFCREKEYDRNRLERDYASFWQRTFSGRLWAGRQIQRLFGNSWSSGVAVGLARHSSLVSRLIVKRTHGPVF
jgi:menaquinone-9 beta-reductase